MTMVKDLPPPSDSIEYDSEEEDAGANLNSWLAQLDTSGAANGMDGEKSILTQSHTMESFRYSVMMDYDSGGIENLDDILNDLCALQQEISHTEQEYQMEGQGQRGPSSAGVPTHQSVVGPYQRAPGATSGLASGPSSGASTLARSDKDSGHGDDVPAGHYDTLPSGGSYRHSGTSDYPSSVSTESPPRTASPDIDDPLQLPPPPAPSELIFPPSPIKKSSTSEAPGAGRALPQPSTLSAPPPNLPSVKPISAATLPRSGGRRAPLLGAIKPAERQTIDVVPNPAPLTAQEREEKIRIAMQKIKDADIRKLFVKVFIQTGDFKTILVDDRMETHDIIHSLFDKCHFKPSVRWTLIEQLPDLYMERIIEDHENMVQLMANWLCVSNNKVLFLETDDKYDLFFQPQVRLIRRHHSFSESSHLSVLKKRLSCSDENYLLNRAAAASCSDTNQRALINDVFTSNGSGCQTPELEGDINMKVDGQKTWRKVRVVLREAGLYTRKNKSSKALTLLVEFSKVDIYRGFHWKKKMRSPSEYCFALKAPQVQKKSKEIKYFCVEDEYQLKKWLTNLRIAKYGAKLNENFRRALSGSAPVKAPESVWPNEPARAMEQARADSVSRGSRDSGFSGASGSSNSLDKAAAAAAAAGMGNNRAAAGAGGPSALPPPAEFSDLPPPPPELLDGGSNSTPTNRTPVHFVANVGSNGAGNGASFAAMSEAFQQLQALDDGHQGFAGRYPSSNSNSSTPRNSVSSADADNSTLSSSSPRSSVVMSGTLTGKRPSLPLGGATDPYQSGGGASSVLRAASLSRGSSAASMMAAKLASSSSGAVSQSQPGTVRGPPARVPPPVPSKSAAATLAARAPPARGSFGFLSDLHAVYGAPRVPPHLGGAGGARGSIEEVDDNDPSCLPPPPPELMQPEYCAQENHYSVPCGVPPHLGQDLMRDGAGHYQHLPPPQPLSSQYGVVQPSPMLGHVRPAEENVYASIGAPRAGGGSMRMAPSLAAPADPTTGDQYSMGRVFASHQSGTIKRAPPILPKRSVTTALSHR